MDTLPPRCFEHASRRLTFADFIRDHGATSGVVPNVPKAEETWTAMERMATQILEPVLDFTGGDMTITYGFCSPERAKHVAKWWTYQPGDQHVGHEVNQRGNPICKRLGFAVDIRVPSAAAVAAFIVRDLPWDRVYYYGEGRSLHVSIAPPDRAPARVAVDMRDFPRVNPPPKIKAPADFFGRILQLPLDLG